MLMRNFKMFWRRGAFNVAAGRVLTRSHSEAAVTNVVSSMNTGFLPPHALDAAPQGSTANSKDAN